MNIRNKAKVFILLIVWSGNLFGFYEDSPRFQASEYQTNYSKIPYEGDNFIYGRGLVTKSPFVRGIYCYGQSCESTPLTVPEGSLVIVTGTRSFESYVQLKLKQALTRNLKTTRENIIVKLQQDAGSWQKIKAKYKVPLVQVVALNSSKKHKVIFLPQSAVKLLSKKEYQEVLASRLKRISRSADAVDYSELFIVPWSRESHSKFSIGPNNKFGGSKDIKLTHVTNDGHWYRIKYWVGELEGHALGWVPKSALSIHPTEEELQRKKLEEERKKQEFAAKLENDRIEREKKLKAYLAIKQAEEEAELVRKQAELARKEAERVRKEAEEEKQRVLLVELRERQREITSRSGAALYEENDLFSKQIVVIPFSAQVELINKADNLYEVKYQTWTGFIDPISVE